MTSKYDVIRSLNVAFLSLIKMNLKSNLHSMCIFCVLMLFNVTYNVKLSTHGNNITAYALLFFFKSRETPLGNWLADLITTVC